MFEVKVRQSDLMKSPSKEKKCLEDMGMKVRPVDLYGFSVPVGKSEENFNTAVDEITARVS